MGALALGFPWLIEIRISLNFYMCTIALGFPELIEIRISHQRHRPRISLADPDKDFAWVSSPSDFHASGWFRKGNGRNDATISITFPLLNPTRISHARHCHWISVVDPDRDFAMGAIALEFAWMIEIRISHGHHQYPISISLGFS